MSLGRVLLIEDEINLGQTLRERLHKEGYDVHHARNLEEARLEIDTVAFDIALVDVMLPDGSGFDFAMALRQKRPATALVFLTALSGPDERVRGLELGAEDYVTKPFHLKELLLRVRNVMKRSRSLAAMTSQVRIRQCGVDFSKYQLTDGQGRVHVLTAKECALLKLLYENRNRAVSRDEILNQIWAEGEYPTTRTVDNFVLRLRKLLNDDSEGGEPLIRSVRGVGYMMLVD
jgi:DNA-binding response OmpR family regulator